MKNLLVLVMSFVILFVTPMCTSSKKTGKSNEQISKSKLHIGISIEQNGKLIKPSNGVVALEKAEFDFIFNLPKPMAVIVNTAFDDVLLEQAAEGQEMASREHFDVINMIAVGLKNPYKVIYVSESSSSPWFYMNDEEHNFSNIELKNGRYRCTRTINNIHDTDTDEIIQIAEIDKPIYLVFLPTSNEDISTEEVEIETNHLTIKWKN